MNKDIRNLLLYALLLFSSFPAVACILMSFLYGSTVDAIFQTLSLENIFIKNLIYAIPLLCFITLFFIPMAITKIALDKKWSKYLNYFFDNMQYPTIALVCYILLKTFFKIEDYLGLVVPIFEYVICFAYFMGVIRKIIKPLYKHFWLFYLVCMIVFAYIIAKPSLNGA